MAISQLVGVFNIGELTVKVTGIAHQRGKCDDGKLTAGACFKE